MNLRIIDYAPLDPEGYAYAVPLGEYHFFDVKNIWLKGIEHEGRNYEWHQIFTSE